MNHEIMGSCHCGAIKVRIRGRIFGMKHCHCTSCRKLHGTLYASNAIARTAEFVVEQGVDHFHDYTIRADKVGRFCCTCCSPIYAYNPSHPELTFVRTGILDGEIHARPLFHWWVSEKAPWYEIHDTLPQFAEAPSDAELRAHGIVIA